MDVLKPRKKFSFPRHENQSPFIYLLQTPNKKKNWKKNSNNKPPKNKETLQI